MGRCIQQQLSATNRRNLCAGFARGASLCAHIRVENVWKSVGDVGRLSSPTSKVTHGERGRRRVRVIVS